MIPFRFKVAYLAFVAILVPAYTVEYGWVNFLWLSNVALLGGLLAAWMEHRRLAGMMLVAVALPEMGWIFDFLLSLVLGGPTPLGMVDYMYNPDIRLFVRLLSLYHLALPFVLFWMVWRLGYEQEAWKPWAVAGCGILLLSFLLSTPERNVNLVWGPGEVQHWMSPYAWLGVVMAVAVLIWWVTHRMLTVLMRHFHRLA